MGRPTSSVGTAIGGLVLALLGRYTSPAAEKSCCPPAHDLSTLEQKVQLGFDGVRALVNLGRAES